MKQFRRAIATVLTTTLLLNSLSICTTFATDADVAPYAVTESVILQGSWYESAYIEWEGTAGKTYKAYYKESTADDTAYKQVDSELVRNVSGNFYRVDVLGLKGGTSYDIRLTVDNSGVEEVITTYTATPQAFDRSGFAFDGTSNAPGAYNADGTVPDNALIIYVTEENKKNVYKSKSITSILGGFNSLNSGNPVILRVVGKVTPLSSSSTSPGMWKNTCGVTIEGVGPNSGFSGWGIGSGDNKDTEFRNMNFVDYPEDAIGFEQAEKLWIHNNNFYSGYNPKDSTAERDKLHGDGSCDLRECDTVTVSYNHFDGSDKTSLIGSSSSNRESTGNITFHHNYFDATNQRTPRVRWHNIHVYNNYYSHTGSYGVGATCNSSIFAENNYFEDAASPFLTSSQGGYASKFSDNEGGVIKAYNNVMVNCRESVEGVDYFNSPSREYRLTAADFTAKKGGWTYNNFDAKGYISANNYILETPEQAKETVLANAGCMEETAIDSMPQIAPPEVSGNVTGVYYYDADESGSLSSFGGINGTGSYFSGSITCKANSASGYRDTEKYNYSGSFSSGGKITFTTSSAAKLTLIASSTASAPVRMEVTNSADSTAVYHGTFQTGDSGNDVLTTINLLRAGTYTISPKSNADFYYIEVMEFDGEIPDETTTQSTTKADDTTETTTNSSGTTQSTESTTKVETTTETTTLANTTPIAKGEATTGFESDSETDDGSGVSVTYNQTTDTWSLKDSSTTAAATLRIPFEKQSNGVIYISGTATPSTSSSKWAFAQVHGTLTDGTTASEILSIASDEDKMLAIRSVDASGTKVYTGFGESLASTDYTYLMAIDLDNKKASVTINGVTKDIELNVSAIDSFYSTTSKSGKRNVDIQGLYVGKVGEVESTVLYGDANLDTKIEAADAAIILQYVLNSAAIDVDAEFVKRCDVDGKTGIEAADAATVLQKTLDNSYIMPIEG